ncbi:MAG TPA: hypothetical protein VNV63_00150 [Nitrospiria bacterium]|jgi:hypothetical protein|nr:hypothetical protein [Nitrospiria bacterium]
MRTIIAAAPSVLTLLLCAGLSYGQDNSPQPPNQATDPKVYPREVTDLPNFTRNDYVRSPRDPFLDKSVKSTIMGEYKANVLDKLVLVSWLDDAGKIVIFVQNTETNDVQEVTSEPNKDHFRIVEIHPNADPKLFEAVISNGSEKGPVRFRLTPPDRNPQIGPTSPPATPTKKPQIGTASPSPGQRKN